MNKMKINLFLIIYSTTILILLIVSSTTSSTNNHLSLKTAFAIENETSANNTSANNNTNKLNEKYISIIQTIRGLLEQTSHTYESGNYQIASQLAITAYLDNYEYLEAPLEQKGYKDLMKEIEVLMRVTLRDAIEQKVPQEQLDKIIDEINVKLFDTVGIFDVN